MFNFNEYLDSLFAAYPGMTPEEYWEKAVEELLPAEKLAAFEHFTGKPYLTTRHRADFKVLFSPPASSSDKDWSGEKTYTYPMSVGYVEQDALAHSACTHNPARGSQQYIPWGQFTQEDVVCTMNYHYNQAETYRHNGHRYRDILTQMKDEGAYTVAELKTKVPVPEYA